MPLPATAKFTHSDHPEILARLEAKGFGQADRTCNKSPKRDEAARAKKAEILRVLDAFPSDLREIPEWVEQCMALGYLGGVGLTRRPGTELAYIAVRTEVLNYEEDSCKRRAASGYPDFFCLRARRGFSHALRVPFDGAAVHAVLSHRASALIEKQDEKRLKEAIPLEEEYLQILEMAKVAMAFGQDHKAKAMLSYTFRRMEAWATTG